MSSALPGVLCSGFIARRQNCTIVYPIRHRATIKSGTIALSVTIIPALSIVSIRLARITPPPIISSHSAPPSRKPRARTLEGARAPISKKQLDTIHPPTKQPSTRIVASDLPKFNPKNTQLPIMAIKRPEQEPIRIAIYVFIDVLSSRISEFEGSDVRISASIGFGQRTYTDRISNIGAMRSSSAKFLIPQEKRHSIYSDGSAQA